jgi:tetrahydromethanopterin S-methyltransferase subunit G
MSLQALGIRIAHLEGAYEQVAARLGGIDHRLESIEQKIDAQVGGLRQEMNARFAQTDGRFEQMDRKFMWVIGIGITSWATILLEVFLKH